MSGVDYYFLEEDCTRFKVSMPFYPYFYILCRKKTEQEVSTFLLKKYAGTVVKVEIVAKEDLDMVIIHEFSCPRDSLQLFDRLLKCGTICSLII